MDEGIKWLEDHIGDAAKGLDHIIAKIFKSLNTPERIAIMRLIESDPRRFNYLKRELETHPTTLSRNINLLKKNGLIEKTDTGYVASSIGRSMLKYISEIETIV